MAGVLIVVIVVLAAWAMAALFLVGWFGANERARHRLPLPEGYDPHRGGDARDHAG